MVLMHGWGYALTWNVCTLVIKNPYSGIYFSQHPLHSILVCQERMWVTPMLSSRVLCLELLHWWCSTLCSGCPWTTRRQSVRLSPQIDRSPRNSCDQRTPSHPGNWTCSYLEAVYFWVLILERILMQAHLISPHLVESQFKASSAVCLSSPCLLQASVHNSSHCCLPRQILTSLCQMSNFKYGIGYNFIWSI